MEELKTLVTSIGVRLDSLDRKRKFELCLILVAVIMGIVSFFFLLSSFKRTTYQTESIKNLEKQNAQYQESNITLINTVNEMTRVVKERSLRDSAANAMLNHNSRIITSLDTDIQNINKKYERTTTVLVSDNDISSYVANEAERLRTAKN